MCDGVTQGQPGMELSLFSRDVIAHVDRDRAVHDMFDAALCLGVCDKIVPGLLIGALPFGHLPAVFVPAGPMTSGLPNDEKARIRQLYAEGKVGRDELLEAESQSYHGAGTCTFYGTANCNQMLMEVMGLHLPGAAFVKPNTPLREALTRGRRATRRGHHARTATDYTPIGEIVDERRIVNAIVGLLATGGSTNHTMHLVAIARAAGIVIDWDDFDELSNGGAAAGAHLPERQGRRQPLPCRRRHGLPDPRTARRRPAARRRAHRRRPRPGAHTPTSRCSTRRSACAGSRRPHAAWTTTCCARVAAPFSADGGLRCWTATWAAR